MSIWTSHPGEPVLARDIDNRHVDQYRNEGPVDVEIDVATASSYHDGIRLAVARANTLPDDQQLDIGVILTPPEARKLAERLLEALAPARRDDVT